MTMADTVAVMNEGRIEQMGEPSAIYELPTTMFVARFLGQSNLFLGEKAGASAEAIEVRSHDRVFTIPVHRNNAPGQSVIVGVRPEKMTVVDAGDEVPAGHEQLPGVVTDVSYTGVSTQYLVRMPWGQEIMVFEQNTVVGDRSRVGDQVVVHWAPDHAFGLDGTGFPAVEVEANEDA